VLHGQAVAHRRRDAELLGHVHTVDVDGVLEAQGVQAALPVAALDDQALLGLLVLLEEPVQLPLQQDHVPEPFLRLLFFICLVMP
jgi:hypothetical protein